jgi:hypothetical protein
MARQAMIDQDSSGILYRRTYKLLPLRRALSFAKCLQGNTTRVRFAEVIFSPTAKSAEVCWYVRWIPANPERHKLLYDIMQMTRVIRAEKEEKSMVFLPNEARDGLYWCVNLGNEQSNSRQTPYEVDVIHNECSCEDYCCRCRSIGILCKHIINANKYHDKEAMAKQIVAKREQAGRRHRVDSSIGKDF